MLQSSVKFYGLAHEDPNAHIANFLEICDTFKINNVDENAVYLRLFPFTLKDKAKAWCNDTWFHHHLESVGSSIFVKVFSFGKEGEDCQRDHQLSVI